MHLFRLLVVFSAVLTAAQAHESPGPESFRLENNGPRIFVNVPNAGHIAIVDREAARATGSWPLTKANSNFPMALDAANHRLFVGCRNPPTLLVLDSSGSGGILTLL